MDTSKFYEFARTAEFRVAAGIAAVGLGVVVGVVVDRIFKKDEAPETVEACTDEEEDIYTPPKLYEVEVVDEVGENRDKMVNDPFVKPDLNNMTDYTKYFAKAKNYNTVSVEKENQEEEEPEEDGQDWSVLITKEEFLKSTGNEDGYVSVTCGYFANDKILAGWNEDLVERDPDTTVGSKAIAQFDDPSVKVVYVRNMQDKVLYEIIRYDDSFEDVVNETKVDPADGGLA